MKYLVGIKTLKTSPYKYFTMKNKSGVSRLIAFSERNTAEKFKDYISQYRFKYNVWPQLDATLSESYVHDSCSSKHSLEKINRLLNVVETDEEYLIALSVQHNVDSIITNSFEYSYDDTSKIKMKGYDQSLIKDINLFRINLEYLT